MDIGHWARWWSQITPDVNCIKYNNLSLSWLEFNRRINQAAHALKAKGVKKGDRVALLMANSNVFLEILFALGKLGAIMLPLNFRLSANELSFIIKDADPSLMIYSPEFKEAVLKLRTDLPSIREYICEMSGGLEGDQEYESWIVDQPDGEPDPLDVVEIDDPLIIMYTSGTTGRPKGAILTHGHIIWNAVNAQHSNAFGQNISSLCGAPLFHIGALNVAATPFLYVGGRLVIQRFFDPAQAVTLIAKEKVNIMFGVPVMFQFMTLFPEWQTADFSSVLYFLVGGAPCPRELIDIYQAKGATFVQGYGMTETAAGAALLMPEHALTKIGSAGRPLFHLLMKIVDVAGTVLGPGEIGEIIVKGPNVIKEYWNMPKETAASIVDGWLHTGDMGYFDHDGFLFVTDRKKDMYISGGENVYPAEVESIILGLDKIGEVAVIGIPDEKWGESGLAIVVPKSGVELTEGEFLEYCRNNLAGYKRPRKVVFSPTPLPRTVTGKLVKKGLKQTYGGAAE